MKYIKGKANTLTFFFITLLIVGLTFFFLEQSIITEATPGYYFDPISIPNQAMVAMLIISLVSIFANYIIRRIRLSVNGIISLIILTVFLVVGVANLLTIPEVRVLPIKFLDGTIHEVTFNLPMSQRITAILTLFVNLSFIFFIALVLPNHKSFLTIMYFFILAIIIVALLAIIYSLVVEFAKYKNIFENGFANSDKVPFSFFNNRNPYASFLLSAQIMVFFFYYLHSKNKRRYIFVFLQLPFIFAIFATFSKTNIILSLFLLVFTFYRHLIMLLIRKKWWRFTLEFILSTQLILFIYFFRSLDTLALTQAGILLRKFLPDAIFKAGSQTLVARINLWRYAWTLIVASPITMLIGDGPHVSRYFFGTRIIAEVPSVTDKVGDYHNGFMEVTHSFGLIGFGVYVFFILMSVFLIFRRGKTHRSLAIFVLLALIVFLARGQTESLAILLFKSEGIMASMTFVLPFLFLMRLSHRHGYGKTIQTLTKKAKA